MNATSERAAEQRVDPSVVDLAAVAEWMDGQGLESGDLADVCPISGGTQNVMLRFRRGDREFVLRRGPPHLRPKTNDVLRREMRVLAALGGTEVPHPRLIASCTDETVLGEAVFYLMEPVQGFNPRVELPSPHRGDPRLRYLMGLHAVDAVAALGNVDHRAVGLGGMGRPEGFLERQVGRWLGELESYGELAGYPGPDLPGVARVADWLQRNRPGAWTPGILHGDFHLGNLLYSRDGPQVAAIVDWEMCTIGDPLLDLGWLLATWPDETGPMGDIDGPLATSDDLPAPDELVRRYAQSSDRDLGRITWYTVLACFKLGIVLEGSHARAFAGKTPKDIGDRLHASAHSLFGRALKLLA